MKKIIIVIIALLFATASYAADTYIRDGATGNLVGGSNRLPTSSVVSDGTNTVGVSSNRLNTNAVIWNGTDEVAVQDNRLNVNTNQLLIGSFQTGSLKNVSSAAFVQLSTGYGYDVTIKAGATNATTILLGNSTATKDNAYPIASSQTVHFDLVNMSQLYVKTQDDSGTNQCDVYWTAYIN